MPSFSLKENRFLDPHGGVDDIERGILRHVDSMRFREDSLRVYRAVQFVARFNLSVSDDTLDLLREYGFDRWAPLDEANRRREG